MRQELIQSALPLATAPVISALSLAAAAALALGQVIDQLEPLVGEHGASALYARSVHLVRRGRASVLSPATGSRAAQLESLREDLSRLEADQARELAIVLITTFADLLTSLIGEPLTNRLLRCAWNPPASPEPSEEKAK